MLKNFRFRMYSSLALALTVVASSGIGPNSLWVLYEPEIPSSLKK